MIGASKMGVDLCEKAEAMGYSSDLCSYARSDISCATVNGGPIGGLPRPDMLVCCNNICGTVLKWYEVQARFFKVPLFILDTPFCHTEFTEEARRYVQKINEYIAFLEVLREKAHSTGAGGLGWWRGQRPWCGPGHGVSTGLRPPSAFDASSICADRTLRGTQAVDYYRLLLAEMRGVASGIGAVPNERYRLLWDNIGLVPTKWLSESRAPRGLPGCDTYTRPGADP